MSTLCMNIWKESDRHLKGGQWVLLEEDAAPFGENGREARSLLSVTRTLLMSGKSVQPNQQSTQAPCLQGQASGAGTHPQWPLYRG